MMWRYKKHWHSYWVSNLQEIIQKKAIFENLKYAVSVTIE